jgi:hypothetical protein
MTGVGNTGYFPNTEWTVGVPAETKDRAMTVPEQAVEAAARIIDPGAFLTQDEARASDSHCGCDQCEADRPTRREAARLQALPILTAAAPLMGVEQAALPPLRAREEIARARESVVLAIAFLSRDAGTDRIGNTVNQVIQELVKADAILFRTAGQEWREPVGWQLVPQQWTTEMAHAGFLVADTKVDVACAECGEIYKAMLAAAPAPPVAEPRKETER